MSFSEDEPKRILIAGLPGTGLRTIKAVVVDNNPPPSIKSMVEKIEIGNKLRDILQQRVLVLRCGGEIQEITSKDKDPLYQHVQAFIFVLDVSEQSNFSIANYWFHTIVKHLHNFSPDARIFLFLHKIDLLADKNNVSDYIRATKSIFEAPGLDIYTHETSIFDPSIYMAFRDVLVKEADEQISIKQYLNQVIEDSTFQAISVYSHDGLPIYAAGEVPSVVEITANVMLSSLTRIKKELEPDDDVVTAFLEMKKNTFIVFKAVDNKCVFVGLSKVRPKLGQMLIESEQIVEVLKKAM
ncbi:MAG: hypothetical protein ACFFDW_07255 [Candidatus Thorarchaeota archaeon]